MDQEFNKLMASKSNEVLQEYITNSGKYKRHAIDVVIDELKKRGQPFDDEQLKEIYGRVQAKEDEANKGELFFDKKTTSAYWKRNIVLEENAPALYSERTIWGFSIFFSALSGAILLAINLNRTGKKIAALITLLFGLVYVFITYLVVTNVALGRPSSGPAYLMGMLGGLILTQVFWKKFIGNTKYRARPIWVPLLICLAFLAGVVWAVLQAS